MSSNPQYIYNLNYKARRHLCRILDADRRWEELGGDHMRFDVVTLTLIGQAVLRDRSPTNELLTKWGERNGTITELFKMLARMDHQWAMSILKPYVDPKHHKLLREGNMMTTQPKSTKNIDLPKPDFSTYGMTSGMLSDFNSKACYTQDRNISPMSQGACANHSVVSNNSKFANDMVNINQTVSSLSLQSKLNSLNPSPGNNTKHQYTAGNESLDIKQMKKNNAVNYNDSVTDNCAWEKMKNTKKSPLPSRQETPGKNLKQVSNKILSKDLSTLEETVPDVMNIAYRDILKATQNFSTSRILGRGGFGTVFRGDWKGAKVAIKRLAPRDGHASASRHMVSLKQSLNELNVLKCCRFDHILPLYGVSLDGADPCLVYQLMVNGSLEDRLLCKNNTPPLTWSQRSHIAECTTKGLNYLHTAPEKPLVHGDIKSANILLDVNMEAKIGDFGLTREGPDCDDTHVKVSSIHGTQFYLPPEYLRQRHLSPSVDVYSYGIVLLEIGTGFRPYDEKRDGAKLLVDYVSDCNRLGRLDSLRDQKAGEENMMWFWELMQIGQKCSSKSKKDRPEMQKVLEHFEKIKEQISMMDRIRKLSREKGTSDEPSKLKQLGPLELQIYYDLKDASSGATAAHSENPSSPPLYQCIQVSGLQDIKGPPDDNSFHTSDIRSPPSSDNIVYRGSRDSGECNTSCAGTVGSSSVCDPNLNFQNDSKQSAGGKVPFPILTVLNLKASDLPSHSDSSFASQSDILCDELSELNDYSRDWRYSLALSSQRSNGMHADDHRFPDTTLDQNIGSAN